MAATLNAIAIVLKSVFSQQFTSSHFSKTFGTMTAGDPLIVHAPLSNFYHPGSGIRPEGIVVLVKSVMFNVQHLRNDGKLRFHTPPPAMKSEPPSIIIDDPPAKAVLYWNHSKLQDEIGIRFR